MPRRVQTHVSRQEYIPSHGPAKRKKGALRIILGILILLLPSAAGADSLWLAMVMVGAAAAVRKYTRALPRESGCR